MTDALAFTIELPDGKYASVNRTTRGWTDPRKSDIYKAIYAAVFEAAEREIARTSWSVAECECLAVVMRVMPARWRADAMNLGKPEMDAMTKAGVWSDDRLANPCLPWIRYDDEGPHRVSIVVMKLHEPANVRIVAKPLKSTPAKTQTPRVDASKAQRVKYDGGPIPDGMCVENGYLVDAGPIMAKILGRSA